VISFLYKVDQSRAILDERYGQSIIKVDVYTKAELIVIRLYTKAVKQNLFEMFNPVAYGKYLVRTS